MKAGRSIIARTHLARAIRLRLLHREAEHRSPRVRATEALIHLLKSKRAEAEALGDFLHCLGPQDLGVRAPARREVAPHPVPKGAVPRCIAEAADIGDLGRAIHHHKRRHARNGAEADDGEPRTEALSQGSVGPVDASHQRSNEWYIVPMRKMTDRRGHDGPRRHRERTKITLDSAKDRREGVTMLFEGRVAQPGKGSHVAHRGLEVIVLCCRVQAGERVVESDRLGDVVNDRAGNRLHKAHGLIHEALGRLQAQRCLT